MIAEPAWPLFMVDASPGLSLESNVGGLGEVLRTCDFGEHQS